MYRLWTPRIGLAPFIVLATAVVLGLTAAAPADACLLAHRLRVVAPHLSAEEVELYAHGNMNPLKIPYTLAAVTPCIGGQADIFSCDGVDLLDHLNLNEIGGGNGNDLWGWTDPVTGAEIAIIGRTNGTAFVDLSDPENAVYLGNLPSHSGSSSWRDIKTFADHAFIVADGQPHGIQVFDLTQLRGVTNPPVTFSATAHYDAIGNAHNIVINEATGFAYAVGSNACSGGLYMVDVNTPTTPTFAGCFSADGYTHDAQCVIYSGPDAQHSGKEICFASNEDTLTIVDVTNKSNPVQLSRVDYTPPGDSHYAHQGWLTEDQQYFVFDDEFDEMGQGHNTRTYVWDVSNVDAPALTGFWDAAGSSIDHNQYIRGNHTYQANYSRGLRILELTDLANADLSEVAFFDTYPESNGNGFDGAWSTYPFFASGIVIVSDINRGLFILQPQTTDPNSTPVVTITAPADGSSSTVGDPVNFAGTATDAEDGDLTSSLSWSSSIDGAIGSGGSFSTSALSAGNHTISASVTDSGGRSGSDSISIAIHLSCTVVYAAGFETGTDGWTTGPGQDCSTGTFVRGTPTEVVNGGVTTQAAGAGEGSFAWFTQPNSAAGTDDVDGGTCESLSPVINVGSDVAVFASYFHGQRDANDDAADGFELALIDAATNAVVLDLARFGDVTNDAVWTSVSDSTVSAPSQVRLRVRATDGTAGGDLIEGAIDAVQVCSGGCETDADCSDGLFCNGAETCNAGSCQAGTPPVCDDGVACTVDACNESTDSCDSTPDDNLCNNGQFCDGTETCDPAADCQAGTPVVCDDGVGCTLDSCDEGSDACDFAPSDALCDDGAFCNGAETCNPVADCQNGAAPCTGPGQTCNETTDACEGGTGCLSEVDFESGAGGWTGGADTCSTGAFVVGSPDATAWQVGGGNPGNAFFTQPNPGGIGSDDVDGGTCEALSAVIDASGQAAVEVSLDYYHGQRDAGDDANDGFTIEVLDGGSVAATMVSVGDVTHNAAWTHVSATVSNPGNVQVRVRATDAAGGGDIVEGGIDNVQICPTTPPPACAVEEDFSGGLGAWVNGAASTCSTGAFVAATPTQQTSTVVTQVGGDHTTGSGTALFTATNSSAGNADVDGGNCILESPSFNVTEASDLSIWYFHGQRDAGDDAAGDFFLLEVSTNGGASYSPLVSIGDVQNVASWTEASTTIPAGSDVRLRVQVSDGSGPGDIVEGGIDDLSICPQN